MKKIFTRLYSIVIAISLAAIMLVGCTTASNPPNTDNGDNPPNTDNGDNLPNTDNGDNAPGNNNATPSGIDISEKTVLTLATFDVDSISDIVAQFNNSSDEYYVQVNDYNTSDFDPWAGDARLKIEMMTGNMPDILDMSSMGYSQLAAMGFLEDLYPYIDSDPDYSRSDFLEGAFRAAEIDGSLYHIFPKFYISSIVGHPAVLGTEPGWNIEEFQAVLDAHPEADLPLGLLFDKIGFLLAVLGFDTDNYVDWDAGTVNFDTPEFIALLEFANTLDELYSPDDDERLIATGRQIMIVPAFLPDIARIIYYSDLFGGEIVIKGFPTDERIGHVLQIDNSYAITTGSKNKEGAWQFLRMFLDADHQLTYNHTPTNKAAFDAKIDKLIDNDAYYVRGREIDKEEILEAADRLKDLVATASGTVGWLSDQGLRNIVLDTVSDYFRGNITAQDAARVIQDKASILMSERN